MASLLYHEFVVIQPSVTNFSHNLSLPCQRIIEQQRSQNRNRQVAQSGWFFRPPFCTPSRQPLCSVASPFSWKWSGCANINRIYQNHYQTVILTRLKDTAQTLTRLQRYKSLPQTSPIPFSSPKNGVTGFHVSCPTAVAKKRIRRTGTWTTGDNDWTNSEGLLWSRCSPGSP